MSSQSKPGQAKSSQADPSCRRLGAQRLLGPGWFAAAPHLDGDVLYLAVLLGRLSSLWESRLEAVFRPLGLQPADVRVLSRLLAAGTGAELATGKLYTNVALSSGGVTKAVDRLRKLGLIVRRRDEADGRVMLVSLTPEGANAAIAANEAIVAHLTEITREIGAEDRPALLESLDRILFCVERSQFAPES